MITIGKKYQVIKDKKNNNYVLVFKKAPHHKKHIKQLNH